VLSGETANTNLYSLWFDMTGLESTIYHTRSEHANHYITDAVDKLNVRENSEDLKISRHTTMRRG